MYMVAEVNRISVGIIQINISLIKQHMKPELLHILPIFKERKGATNVEEVWNEKGKIRFYSQNAVTPKTFSESVRCVVDSVSP